MTSTSIEWADVTWNPIRGCSRVSEGCRNCYAERMAARFSYVGDWTRKPEPFAGFAARTASGPRWTGKVALVPGKLDEPLRWRKPRRVFVNSMSDLFHEGLSDTDIAAVFGIMAATPHLTYQILTKRPARMLKWLRWVAALASEGPDLYCQREAFRALGERADKFPMHAVTGAFRAFPWPLPNVWLGVSVEDQKTADERIPLLLQVPAAVRFVSAEPMLGLVDLHDIKPQNAKRDATLDALRGTGSYTSDYGVPGISIDDVPCLDWVIVGGESGPHARPCEVSWIRSVVEQCRAAGVPAFVKQLGARPIVPAGRLRHYEWPGATFTAVDPLHQSTEPWYVRLRDRKGGDPSEWPAEIRVREFPREELRRPR